MTEQNSNGNGQTQAPVTGADVAQAQQAVAKQETVQFSLLEWGGLASGVDKVFGGKTKDREVKDKDGKVIRVERESEVLMIRPLKEIKLELGLQRKDQKEELAEAILKQRDNIKMKAQELVNRLAANPDWTGTRIAGTRSKSGELAVTIKLNEVKRKKGEYTPERIAAFYTKATGVEWTAAMVEEMIRNQTEKLKGQNVEVTSTTINPPALPAPKPEDPFGALESDEDKVAAEELKAEAAAK